MAARIKHPTILSAALTDLDVRRTKTPDMSTLVNTAKEAMLINTITITTEGNGGYECGGLVFVSFQVGRFKLMNAPVPVWMLTPNPRSDNYYQAQTIDSISRRWHTYRWVLPKPLYVPAGEALVPTFSRESDSHTDDIDITISYAGHVVERIPRPVVVDVPFVANVIGTGGTVSAWEGVAAGLGNPFNVPLQIQRLIGRIRTPNLTTKYLDSVVSSGSGGAQAAAPLDGGYLTDDGSAGVLTRIRDSVGVDLVKDPIPFDALFSGKSRMWPFERTLARREYLSVYFRDVPTNTNPMIAMIASRQERL